MGDFIRSAFSYFGGPSQGVRENELVGEMIEVGRTQFRIRRVIAEGGYSIVFEGYSHSQGKSYALKRLFAQDQETVKVVMNEIEILKQLSGHPNIMKFFGVACMGKAKGRHAGNEYMIVTELCSGGSLKDYLPVPHHGKMLLPNIILQILAQTSRAIQHMHKQSPPIIHRDLKIENILLSEFFTVKLCDFGSATTTTYAPSVTWSAVERGRVQESLEKVTTPMYRSPEMLDLYLNYPINEALDIWAFGCIIFYLVCGYHPFEDSAKLAILNANFNLPPCDIDFEPFHNLIRQMLLVDPTQRPNINSIYGELSDLATTRNVPAFDSIIFNEEVKRRLRNCPKPKDAHESAPPRSGASAASPSPSHPPPPPSAPSSRPSLGSGVHVGRNAQRHCPPSSADGSVSSTESIETSERPSGGVLGFLKGSAGHLIKNIRETSSRVMEAVAAAIPSDLDLQYITSRIAVMSYPAESGLEAAVGSHNSMEEAQTYLDRHHPNSYAVYNLSPRAYRSSHWFGGRVSFRPLEHNRAPMLCSLVELCQNARLWLAQKPENVCVIHCTDGRQLSAVMVCCLLCFCRVFTEAVGALKFFVSKRGPVKLTPAQVRYIDYVAQLVAVPPHIPHNHPISLLSIIIAPIPSFNRLKNGCRPYVDVYQGNKKVFSSMTEYESLRTYEFEDRKIEVILNNLSVYGDVKITVYHARSFFAGKGKASATKICQLQFHTGFINRDVEKITFSKSQLDQLHSSNGISGSAGGPSMGTSSTSRYAESFHVILHLSVSPSERPRQGSALVFPWETLPAESARKPMLCFLDAFEMRSVMSPAALKATGYSATGHPLSDPSDSRQVRDLRSSRDASINGEGAQKDSGCASATPQRATADVDTLIEGLKANQLNNDGPVDSTTGGKSPSSATKVPAGSQASFNKKTERSNDVGDLLDISSAASSSSPSASPPQTSQRPNLGGTATTNDALFEDLFATSASTPTGKPEPADWQNPWPEAAVNLNPFDPFGIATEPPERQDASSTSPPSPTTPKSPSDFDPFGMRSHSKVRSSCSTSNLFASSPSGNPQTSSGASGAAPGATAPVHISSSSSNLTHGGNPFQDFGEFFAAAANKATSSSHSPTHYGYHHSTSTTSADANKPVDQTFGFPFSSASTRQSAFTPHQTTTTTTPPPQQQQPAESYASPKHNSASNTTSPGFQGTRPRVTEETFEDLLGGFSSSSGQAFGSSRRQQQPKTLAEIRHQKLAQTEDPEALKVIEWLEGKEKNVRALLCTLNSVLWEGVRWEQISMADVMTVKQVKQQYRRAARAVHPDKWMNTEHMNMAKLILVELNDAMAEFERQEECAA